MANAMKYEKEIFWIENSHLPEDERQRRWTTQTAEFTALLESTAPIRPLDLKVDAAGQKTEPQHATITLPRQPRLAQSPSVMATTILLAPSGG